MSYLLLSFDNQVARKSHRCIWCPERIELGKEYCYQAGVDLDGFTAVHWHPECYDAAQRYFRTSGEDEFEPHACQRGTCDEARRATPRETSRLS